MHAFLYLCFNAKKEYKRVKNLRPQVKKYIIKNH